MAWPLTPFRTMVDGSTFWDAALGNAIQTGVNGVVAGTYSVAAVVVDAVGGVVVAGEAGAVKVSKSIGGTTVPTPTPTKASVYRESVPLAIGRFTQTGTADPVLVWGVNIASASRSNVGLYLVNLVVAGAATLQMGAVASGTSSAVLFSTSIISTTQAQVIAVALATDSSTDLAGTGFIVVVYGA